MRWDHLSRGINAMHLKYRLRNIQTDRANLAHGRLPSMWFASRIARMFDMTRKTPD
jgi:hypothetical protein